jgi:POT family proton-dependent oligopeptide transporter
MSTVTTPDDAGTAAGAPRGGFFGHPRGLATLFFTEMWERFSYYGMRALLILYMTETVANGGLGMEAEKAGGIYGLYTAFVYLLALPGGWIADRLMGQRRAVMLGGIVIALGHYCLAIESIVTFYSGLILIVLGTGLLKPNISAIVGDLYTHDSAARRDAGFSIFYMGINIGAMIAPLICSYLGEHINWHYGFGAAGVGMTFGVLQYAVGRRHLQGCGELKCSEQQHAQGKTVFAVALVVAVVAALGLYFANQHGVIELSIQKFVDASKVIIVGLALATLIFICLFGKLSAVEIKRIVVIGILFVGAAMFWSGFEQAGSGLNLFAKTLTDRNLFGWEMPAGFLQAVNPFLIIVLAPVFGALWIKLAAKNLNPSIPAKFGLGLIFLGLGFLVMVGAAKVATAENPVLPTWLVLTYLLHTTGELCLSPVGLSSMTKLAPKQYVGQMMGIWFMAAALGNLIAGELGGEFESMPLPDLFGQVFRYTVIAGGVFLVLAIPIRKKLMGGVK